MLSRIHTPLFLINPLIISLRFLFAPGRRESANLRAVIDNYLFSLARKPLLTPRFLLSEGRFSD
jgi:hypothetical protein